MGCKKKTTQILKRIAAGLKPVLVEYAVSTVAGIEAAALEDPAFWTNSQKRSAAFGMVKTRAKQLANELPNRTIGLLIEFAVEAVKGPDDESDLGKDDLAETVTL